MEKEQITLEELAVNHGCDKVANCTYPEIITDPKLRNKYVVQYCCNGKHNECSELVKKSDLGVKNPVVHEERSRPERRRKGVVNVLIRSVYDVHKSSSFLMYK